MDLVSGGRLGAGGEEQKGGLRVIPGTGKELAVLISEVIKSRKDVGWTLELEKNRRWSSPGGSGWVGGEHRLMKRQPCSEIRHRRLASCC